MTVKTLTTLIFKWENRQSNIDRNVNRSFTEEKMHTVKKKKPTKMMVCTNRQEVQIKITVTKKVSTYLVSKM